MARGIRRDILSRFPHARRPKSKRSTISARLNLLIAGLFLIALLVLAGLLFLRGTERVQAEEKAMLRAAEFIVHAAVPKIARSSDPDRDIAGVLAQLRGLKHIAVFPIYSRQAEPRQKRVEHGDLLSYLASFLIGERSENDLVRIEFGNSQADVIAVEIRPNPVDELQEIVEEVADILLISTLFLSVVFLISQVFVNRSLQPLTELHRAVQRMQTGDYDVAVSAESTPEFDTISAALTELGTALRQAKSESQRLSAQLVSAQDRERNEIAKELHDELGSQLFSIRAQAETLQSKMAPEQAGTAKASEDIDRLIAQLDELQKAHRHVLLRLSPPGLHELGLRKALLGLVEKWRQQHSEITFDAQIAVPEDLDETTSQTAYRIVQEGVTNALRHAGATTISIEINGERAADLNAQNGFEIAITDDGTRSKPIVPGFGLRSMDERVRALGGTMSVAQLSPSGTRLEVEFLVGSA